MYIPDANVLLYAVNSDDPHHAEARIWLEGALAGCGTVALTWATMLAFVRISTRKGIFERPLTVQEAIGVVESWMSHPATLVLVPTTRHLPLLHGLLESAGIAGSLASDAHLAALALEYGADIVTYDGDFARFDGVKFRQPGDR